MQHLGDLIVDGEHETTGQVTGTTYVRSGGRLIARAQLAGGLIIDAGGVAIVHGQVARNVVNHGTLTLYGQVVGRLIGDTPVNSIGPDQILGDDLEVPFRGTTVAWNSSL